MINSRQIFRSTPTKRLIALLLAVLIFITGVVLAYASANWGFDDSSSPSDPVFDIDVLLFLAGPPFIVSAALIVLMLTHRRA
jgi:hypothetical protein